MPPKPKSVSRAIGLLCVGLSLGFLGAFAAWNWEQAMQMSTEFSSMLMTLNLIFYVILADANQGRKWARMALTVFYVLSTCYAIPGLVISLAQSPPFGYAVAVLIGAAWAIDTFAFVLLFQRPSNAWFAQVTAERVHARNPAP